MVDAALALANEHGLPVVVAHTLENRYPHASARLHRFILEASQELGSGIEARGLRFVRYLRRSAPDSSAPDSSAPDSSAPDSGVPGSGAPGTVDVVAHLARRAAAVVADDVPTFVTRTYADALAAQMADRAVLAVDACCLVPMNAFAAKLGATKAFRAAHTPKRATHLDADLAQEPTAPRFDGDLGVDTLGVSHTDLDGLDADALGGLVASCGVDLSVPPAMPAGHQVKLFRLALWRIGYPPSGRTEYVVTNDVAGSSSKVAREECAVRWVGDVPSPIEQFHREVKQTTGIEKCQCRKERIQRNHVGCAILVWVRLASLARSVGTTVYALKRDLLSDYMVEQLRNPSIQIDLLHNKPSGRLSPCKTMIDGFLYKILFYRRLVCSIFYHAESLIQQRMSLSNSFLILTGCPEAYPYRFPCCVTARSVFH
ncbi:MAG: hypothetical protein AAF624_08615 [Bacteroidota bacterium]